MKKKLLAVLFGIALISLIVSPVLATVGYAAPITLVNTSSTSYAMLSANISVGIDYMATDGFFTNSEGLDTRVMLGINAQRHMLTDDMLLLSTPSPANSTRGLYFTTGNSNLASFAIIPGYGGYVTTADDDDLEISDNFTVSQEGWVDTTYSVNRTLVEKPDTFITYVSATGNITSVLYGIEDFLVYTEDDDNGKLTISTPKVLAADADTDEDCLVYYDFGVGYFDALDEDFEIYMASTSTDQSLAGMAITNTVGSFNDWAVTDITVLFYRNGADYSILLKRGKNVATDTYVGSANTLYYCTLLREAGNDTVELEIYSDAARESLEDTLTLAGYGAATKYRYAYGFVNYNTGGGGVNWDGYVQNLNLGASQVMAVAVPAGNHTVTTTANTANLTISVDGATSGDFFDTVSIATISGLDNADNWTFMAYNSMAYSDNTTITVDGVEVLWYEPIAIIESQVLPDRQGGDEDGYIYWGTTPADIDLTLGGMETDYAGASVDVGASQDIAPVITSPVIESDATKTAAIDDPLTDTAELLEEMSHDRLPVLLQYWWIYILASLCAFVFVWSRFPNLMVAGVVFCVPIGYAIAVGVMDFWVMAALIVLLAGCVLMENRRTV